MGHEANGLRTPALLEAWWFDLRALALAFQAGPPVAVRLIEVAHGLLQHHITGLRQPLPLWRLFGLRDAELGQDGVAGLLPSGIQLTALGQGVVPHHTGAAERTSQRHLLMRVGVEPVAVALLHPFREYVESQEKPS